MFTGNAVANHYMYVLWLVLFLGFLFTKYPHGKGDGKQ